MNNQETPIEIYEQLNKFRSMTFDCKNDDSTDRNALCRDLYSLLTNVCLYRYGPDKNGLVSFSIRNMIDATISRKVYRIIQLNRPILIETEKAIKSKIDTHNLPKGDRNYKLYQCLNEISLEIDK